MNDISLQNFRKEIVLIREYLKYIEYANHIVNYRFSDNTNRELIDLLAPIKWQHVHFKTDKKVFEYKAVIISLYGLLENYIETWIKEYLENVSQLVNEYNKIDEVLRNNHFNLSIKLLDTIIHKNNAKYQHISKEEVLTKLNQCIITPTDYQLNTEAFVLSSGNLKHNKIVELIKFININLDEKLKKNEVLMQYIQEEKGITHIENLPPSILYSKIDDLVERRNMIAHGSFADIRCISKIKY